MNKALSDAIRNAVRQILYDEFFGSTGPFLTGTWVAAESEDPNLSEIEILGDPMRFVPKAAGLAPVPGDTVLCVRSKNLPLTIIAILAGDITLAEI